MTAPLSLSKSLTGHFQAGSHGWALDASGLARLSSSVSEARRLSTGLKTIRFSSGVPLTKMGLQELSQSLVTAANGPR